MHPTHTYNGQSSNKRRSTTDSEADDMRQHTSTAIKKKNANATARRCLVTVRCQELQDPSSVHCLTHGLFRAHKLQTAPKAVGAVAQIAMQPVQAPLAFVFVFAFVWAFVVAYFVISGSVFLSGLGFIFG